MGGISQNQKLFEIPLRYVSIIIGQYSSLFKGNTSKRKKISNVDEQSPTHYHQKNWTTSFSFH